MAQVALFSVINWPCFQLTKTTADTLELWQKQMPGISVRISYEDVLGNSQDNYEIVLQ